MIPIRDTIPSRNRPFGTWIVIAANGLVFIFELILPEPVLQAVFYYFGIVPARYSHPDWAAWVGLPFDDYWPFAMRPLAPDEWGLETAWRPLKTIGVTELWRNRS